MYSANSNIQQTTFSNNFASELVHLLPFPVYAKNEYGNYISCNSEFSDSIFGLSISEIIGKKADDFISVTTEDELRNFKSADEKLLESNQIQIVDQELFCADGRKHYFREFKYLILTENEEKQIIGILIDLTERNDLKNSLERESQLFKIFMDYIPDAIFFKDEEFKFTEVNNAMVMHLGVANTLNAIGKTVFDIYDEKKAKEIHSEETSVIEKGIIVVDEKTKVNADGKETFQQITKVPVPDNTGKIIGLLGIIRDITKVKRAEQKYKLLSKFEHTVSGISKNFLNNDSSIFEKSVIKSLDDLNNFFDSERVSIFLRKIEGGYENKYSNLRVGSGCGFLKSEECEKLLSDLEPKLNSMPLVLTGNDTLFEQTSAESLDNLILIPIFTESKLSAILAIKNPRISKMLLMEYKKFLMLISEVLSSAFDNYEKEKYRISVEAELQKLLRAVNQSANAVVITDVRGVIEYANPGYSKMTGKTNEEILGKPLAILNGSSGDKTGNNSVWEKIQKGEEWSGESKLINESGEIYWEQATISPIRNSRGEISNYLAIIEDITEKISLENQLAISQKLESIGQLAAGISHEINTPMQYVGDNNGFLKTAFDSMSNYIKEIEKIDGFTPEQLEKINELKLRHDMEFLMEEVPEAFKQSFDGIGRVTKIVKAMKDFSHPSVENMSAVDINSGIKNTVIISKNEWKYSAVLETKLDENLPLVECSLDALNQVILNMIVNAAHAIEEKYSGTGELGKILIETSSAGDQVLIKISDTGKGIPQENLKKIFDPFFTTKEVGKGTGQGLAIAHDIIVNKHNASILVDSKIGDGTTFTIILPIKRGK